LDALSPFRNASYAARFAVGVAARVPRALSPSARSSERATWLAMSACTLNMSVSDASNACCHSVVGAPPGVTRISSGVTRTRLGSPGAFSHLTVAVRR
jgi:hypothetical protein